jgi:PAS domain S-box-containing protein
MEVSSPALPLPQHLAERMATALLLTDDADRISYLNPAAERLTGYSLPAIQGKRFHDIFHGSQSDCSQDATMLCGGFQCPHPEGLALEAVEQTWLRANGEALNVRCTMRPLCCGDVLTGVLWEAQDITAETRTRKTMREADALFAETFAWAPVGIAQVGANGEWLRINARYCEILGYSPQELVGKTFVDLTHPDDVATDWAMAARIRSREISRYALEKRYIRKDGSITWVSVVVTAVWSESTGEFKHWIAVAEDINDRKRAEVALHESESRFKQLSDSGLLGFFFADIHGRILDANESAIRMMGYSREEILAGHVRWDVITPPEQMDMDLARVEELIRNGSCTPYEKQYIRKDGSRVDVIIGYSFLPDSREKTICFILDNSARKRTERALQESEARFRMMADSAPIKIWVIDTRHQMVYANCRLCDYLGVTQEALSMEFWANYLHPDDMEATQQAYLDAFCRQVEFTLEHRVRSHAGEYRWLLVTGAPRFASDGEFLGYIGTSVDIHDRKLAEQELLESESRFRLLADSAPVMIWQLDETGGVIYQNAPTLAFTGLSGEETRGYGWERLSHPEDLARCAAIYTQNFQTRQPYTIEQRIRRHDGEYRWLLSSAVPRFTPDGRFLGYIGSSVDISDAKLAQEDARRYAERLQQSNRELEQFATITSHDLQAPLRKVLMFSDSLNRHEADNLSPQGRDAIARIQRSALGMQKLISDLLDLSRINRKGKPFAPVSLATVLSEVLTILQPQIAESQGSIQLTMPLPILSADDT